LKQFSLAKTASWANHLWIQSKMVVAIYCSFILSCVLVYIAETLQPGLLTILSLNGRNVWGIITSLFVHGSFTHLWVNTQALAWEIVLMAILLDNHQWKERHVVTFFCAAPFVSAIAADVVQVAMLPNVTSFGASGVAYGIMGLVVICAVRGLGEEIGNHGIRACFSRPRSFNSGLDLLFSVPFVYVIVESPSGFLGVGTGADSLIHGLSFIFSIAIAEVYFSHGLVTRLIRQKSVFGRNDLQVEVGPSRGPEQIGTRFQVRPKYNTRCPCSLVGNLGAKA
jgi:Rhomboid family